MTQLTIELPDKIAAQLTTYLKTYPSESLTSLIQAALAGAAFAEKWL